VSATLINRTLKKSALLTRPTPARQDAPFPRLRSRLESILNVTHTGKELFQQLGVGRVRMLRLRCFHRLRPCWMNFLNVLHGLSHFIPAIRVFSFPKTRLGLSITMVLLDERVRYFHHGQVLSNLLFEIQRKGGDDLVEGFWLF
jgi:hypothetical protein